MKTKLKEILQDKVIWTLLIVVLIGAVGIYGNRLLLDNIKGKSVARVSFNFEGVDEGLNPQGGVFDAQMMKSEAVLEKAVGKLGWSSDELDLKNLANHIIIKGIVPGDVMGRILPSMLESQNMQMERVGGLSYHPTQYQIALSLSRDMGLSTKDANLLMDAMIESYSETFVERYKDTQVIDEILTQVDPESYDYSEYMDLVSGQLDVMKSYLKAKEQVSKDFKSTATGYSFGDLVAEIELIEDVELGNVQALLDSFVITKDSRKSQIVYKNMISRMKKENEKHKQEAQVLRNLANGYKKDKKILLGSGVLIPDLAQDLELGEDEEKQSLYDTLVEQSILADNRANKIGKQVRHYEGLLANLNAQNQSDTTVPIDAYTEEVEQSIKYIATDMQDTMDHIKKTVDDYYEKEVFDGSITPVGKARYIGSFRLNLIKDTATVAGIAVLMTIIALIYLLAKKKPENQ